MAEVIIQNRTWQFLGTAYDTYIASGDAGNVPTDHTGWSIKAQIRTRRGNELVATLNAVFIVLTEGTFQVYLTREQSCALPTGDYWWDIVATDPSGNDQVYHEAEPISVHAHPTNVTDNSPALLPDCDQTIKHQHEISDVIGLEEALDFTYGWDEVQNKPSTFPPDPHTHDFADITGKPLTFPPSAHTHVEAEIADLDKFTQAEVLAITDQISTNLATHEADTNNPHQTTWDTLLSKPSFMTWMGEWVPGTTAEPNEVYRDGATTSIANTQTTDRPAPYAIGEPVTALPVTPSFTTPSHTGLVRCGNRYTFTEGGWLTEVLARVPNIGGDIDYKFVLVDETDPANPIARYVDSPPGITDSDWFRVALGRLLVKEGTILSVYIQILNSGTNSTVTGGWLYEGTDGGAAPATQQWNRRDQQDELRISYTDLDLVDRTGELSGVIAGSTILMAETANPGNYFEYEVLGSVDMGTAIEYIVSLIDSGNGGPVVGQSTTLTATVPVPQATDYFMEAGYWATNNPLSFATVEGVLDLSGNLQVGAEDNLFGIDLVFQPGTISPDWDLISYSEVLVGNEGSGSVGSLGVQQEPGWGQWDDATYHSGNKLSINNARTKITIDGAGATTELAQHPSGASMWDTATSKIIPRTEGDTYAVRLTFKCEDGGTAPEFDVELDIGGGIGVILSETKTVSKNLENRITIDWLVFVGSTFLANGGDIYIDTTYDAVSVDFWDFSIFIQRAYMA